MLFDAIGLGLALLFIGLGAQRGAFAGFLRVATVVVAYVSAYLVATHLSKALALLTGMSRIAVAAGLGALSFGAVYLVLGIVSTLLIRAERERRSEGPRSGYDRAGGAFFGVLQAAVTLLLLAVMGSVLDAAYRAGLPQGVDASQSFLVASTRRVVAAGVGRALGDSPGSKLAVRMISDPGQALTAAQKLLAGPRFSELQADGTFWEMVADGQVDRALTRESFGALMYDGGTRAGLADLGFVPEAARNDPLAFRLAMRDTLEAAAPRIRALRNDPQLAKIADDPDVRAAIESGNSAALLAHPQVRSLVNRLLRDFENAPEAPQPSAPPAS